MYSSARRSTAFGSCPTQLLHKFHPPDLSLVVDKLSNGYLFRRCCVRGGVFRPCGLWANRRVARSLCMCIMIGAIWSNFGFDWGAPCVLLRKMDGTFGWIGYSMDASFIRNNRIWIGPLSLVDADQPVDIGFIIFGLLRTVSLIPVAFGIPF